jgi:hypothetical protein
VSRRCALLVVHERALPPGVAPPGVAPPGIDPRAYADAMIEDVAETLYGLSGVDSAVACSPGRGDDIRALVWPDMPVAEVPGPDTLAALRVVADGGYDEAVLVTADAPDLPQMVVAKLFQALARSPVVVAPADGGGAVALGVRLPAPGWLHSAGSQPAGLDSPSIVADLRAGAPAPGLVQVVPGWHRLRTAADVQRLDPGLEGWERTRMLLTGLRAPLEE